MCRKNFFPEQAREILLRDGVRSLAIHIDEPLSLIDRNQIIGRFAQRIHPLAQNDHGPGHQQLTTATGVLHVADDYLPIQQHVSDEAVGAIQENGFSNMVVSHERKYILLRAKTQWALERRGKGE